MKFLNMIVALMLILMPITHSTCQNFGETIQLDSTINTQKILWKNAVYFFENHFPSAEVITRMNMDNDIKMVGKGLIDDRYVTVTVICRNGHYEYYVEADDRVETVNLNINRLGSLSYLGITTAEISIPYKGNPTLDMNSVNFRFTDDLMSKYSYYYDDLNPNHKPLFMTRKQWKYWKGRVNYEVSVLQQTYVRTEDTKIFDLMRELKREMIVLPD